MSVCELEVNLVNASVQVKNFDFKTVHSTRTVEYS